LLISPINLTIKKDTFGLCRAKVIQNSLTEKEYLQREDVSRVYVTKIKPN
jgi:hypothetical protein